MTATNHTAKAADGFNRTFWALGDDGQNRPIVAISIEYAPFLDGEIQDDLRSLLREMSDRVASWM